MCSEVVFYFDVAHVHECFLYGVNTASPGACHNVVAPTRALAQSVMGAWKRTAIRFVDSWCAVAPEVTYSRSQRYWQDTLSDGGHTVEEEVYECTHAVDCVL